MAEIRVEQKRRSGLGWLWVILALALVALAIWWFNNNGRDDVDTTPATTPPPAGGTSGIERASPRYAIEDGRIPVSIRYAA